MALDDKIRENIESYLCEVIDGLVIRKKKQWESQSSSIAGFKPFHKALLSDDIMMTADFERSFSTVMGIIFEGCASIIAESRFETVRKQNDLIGNIGTDTNAKIDEIITGINKGIIFSNYINKVSEMVEFAKNDKSNPIEKSVISDLYVRDSKDNQVFFELKTPKPNKEQCLNITRKHLWIHCIEKQSFPKTKTYYAMSYNPYGENNPYKHSFSTKYMNVENQVLIGKVFWDFIGGNNAYEELLTIFSKVGIRKTMEIKNLIDEAKSPDTQQE